MGGCIGKSSFTVTKPRNSRLKGIHPFMFSIPDAEVALTEAEEGEYLLYRDHGTDRVVLSVRMSGYIRHYRITEVNKLYFLEGQPYAYLDSIIYYHQKHKLNGARLKRQANLSARVVRSFAHKIARSNGNVNNFHNMNNRQSVFQISSQVSPVHRTHMYLPDTPASNQHSPERNGVLSTRNGNNNVHSPERHTVFSTPSRANAWYPNNALDSPGRESYLRELNYVSSTPKKGTQSRQNSFHYFRDPDEMMFEKERSSNLDRSITFRRSTNTTGRRSRARARQNKGFIYTNGVALTGIGSPGNNDSIDNNFELKGAPSPVKMNGKMPSASLPTTPVRASDSPTKSYRSQWL